MSLQYDEYLKEHIANVERGFDWLCEHIEDMTEELTGNKYILLAMHDASKYNPREYGAYDDYFYGGNKSYAVVQAFKLAWLHHIHNNPHHWQHWILVHDDEPEEVLEMPYPYVVEMICDWWSFSWKSGNLMEIFDWYDQHKDGMKLHPRTRKLVEEILGKMRDALEAEKNGEE